MKRVFFLLLLFNLSLPALAEALSNLTLDKALGILEKANGFPAEGGLSACETQYFSLPKPQQLSNAEIVRLFEVEQIPLCSSLISDFAATSELLFQESPLAKNLSFAKDFRLAIETLQSWRRDFNQYLLTLHPGLAPLDSASFLSTYSGRGVTIAVFDVFEPELLAIQRQRASIEEPIRFGKPLEMSHGNVVIDQILRIAPNAHIVPVWADSRDYVRAIDAILARDDILIVNMSRGFLEGKVRGELDPDFEKGLLKLIESRILVKALGNTGTDLRGVVTPRRKSLGLGPVNNLATYDLALIDNFSSKLNPDSLVSFAINLSLFATDIALSASIPGENIMVQSRTLGMPSEGVWSPSNETFESGSSFAAPQISALLALIGERRLNSDKRVFPKAWLRELFLNVKVLGEREIYGKGLPTIR